MTVDNQVVEEARQKKTRRARAGSVMGRWLHSWLARCLARWRPLLLTILLIASTGFCAGYFFFVYRTDLQTDDAVAHQVVKVASDGAVALLSYSPGSLTQDFNNAKSLVTEEYLAYYQQFAEKIVGPAAMRGGSRRPSPSSGQPCRNYTRIQPWCLFSSNRRLRARKSRNRW